MFNYDAPLSPYVSSWDANKEDFIEKKILEICTEIQRRGVSSIHATIYDMIYEYIDENIENYIEK